MPAKDVAGTSAIEKPPVSEIRGLGNQDFKADHRFQPGQSGNPLGRPKGARNKLGEDFIADMHRGWERHREAIIEYLAENEPGTYARLMAALTPKEMTVNAPGIETMGVEEAMHFAALLKAAIAKGETDPEAAEAMLALLPEVGRA